MSDFTQDPNARFAVVVDRLREERGWTVRELAARSDLDLGELESILEGKEDVQLDAIVLLSRAFGLPPGDLVDGP